MIPRSGWISHGVALPDVESVADHSFTTAMLALLLADLERERGQRVDAERVLRMALLHDLSETLTFDISKGYLDYLGKRGKAIKDEVEEAAWKHILNGITKTKLRSHYSRLQYEFDAEQTLESRIVHAADRLDILLQVVEYAKRGYPKPLLANLWSSTEREVRNSKVESVIQLHKTIRSLFRGVDSRPPR
jgi:putative hydrolase of HD superfamily